MGKVVPLSALIRDHVRAGMCLHLGVTHLFPHAAVAEVIRAMAGTDPRFTLAAAGISGSGIAMLHLGMVERVITSYAGDIYPSPAPNAVVQRVYADRSVTFEHWSLLTLVQRMAAAARARFGWRLRVADRLEAIPDPDAGELARLREYDPRGAFLHDG